jgi:thiol-disulfide isomerase/thioredoxin
MNVIGRKVLKGVWALAVLGPLACHAAGAATQGDTGLVAEDPRLARLVGQPGPALALHMVDGSTFDLATAYGSKPVYLKLWATYCMACRVQMPGFERTYEALGNEIQVLAVNAGVGDDVQKVRDFAARTGMRMPVAIDDGALGAWLKMQETPLHLLMDADGRIVYAGHQDSPRLDAALQALRRHPGSGRAVVARAVRDDAALNPGQAVPALSLRGPGNAAVAVRGGAGPRPRAVLFTATWCETYLQDTEPATAQRCREFREQADRLSRRRDVEWLGVVSHLWTDSRDLQRYETRVRPKVPYAVDADGVAFRIFGVRRFPCVALIDAQGRLVRLVGPDDGDLAAAVAALGGRG